MNYAEGQNVKFERLFSPRQDAQGDKTSEVIDTRGYESLCLVLQTGVLGAMAGPFKVQHSNTNQAADFTDVPNTELVGNKQANLVVANDDDNKLAAVDYVGIRRYVRVLFDRTSGGANGEFFAGLAILGHGHLRPETLPAFA